MLIILLTPGCYIAPESAFHWEPGGTIMDGFVLPRTAGDVLAIRDAMPVKAIAGTNTYAFWHRGKNYRALTDIPGAPLPLVLQEVGDHPHWHECRYCRDGVWCDVGLGIILDASEAST